MSTSESHSAISGSRVSDERLVAIRDMTEAAATLSEVDLMVDELLSLRSEPSEPLAWQEILRRAIEGNPTIESPEDHVEYLIGCIRAALASPKAGEAK